MAYTEPRRTTSPAARVSQPYVFRLFGTKKELFQGGRRPGFRETLELFQRSAAGLCGDAALDAIGRAYIAWLVSEPLRPQEQLQAYAVCDDLELCEVVRACDGDLVT